MVNGQLDSRNVEILGGVSSAGFSIGRLTSECGHLVQLEAKLARTNGY